MRALIALGSNLGDRGANLEEARRRLAAAGVGVVRQGEVLETAAWGGDPGRPYLNQVVEVECTADPWALLDSLKDIEQAMGRDLTAARNSPRTIDLDILAIAGTTISSPGLTVPHPRLGGRSFLRGPLETLEGWERFFAGG